MNPHSRQEGHLGQSKAAADPMCATESGEGGLHAPHLQLPHLQLYALKLGLKIQSHQVAVNSGCPHNQQPDRS